MTEQGEPQGLGLLKQMPWPPGPLNDKGRDGRVGDAAKP